MQNLYPNQGEWLHRQKWEYSFNKITFYITVVLFTTYASASEPKHWLYLGCK